MKHYGIDLGTNNCTISCLNTEKDNIKLSILKDSKGRSNIRTKITMYDNENIEIASNSNSNLKNTFSLIKGKLGSERSVLVNNKKVSTQFCAAVLLNYIKSFDEKIDKAVITIPTFYNQSKRNCTIEAAKQAGFLEVKLIEEPTSAVMYHLFKEFKDNKELLINCKNILVFDFGGGTLDLSLVNVKIDKNSKLDPKVIAIDGLENFGGYLIDILLAKAILISLKENSKCIDNILVEAIERLNNHINSYKDMNNIEVFTDNDKVNSLLYNVISEAERIKIELSSKSETKINIENYLTNEIITREEFEELILENEMILMKISDLLNDFKIKNKFNIDEIILVGGTSQIPKIFELIKSKFPTNNIVNNSDYINSVGYGAAIISALNNGEKIDPFGGNVCTGVLPRDIFISCNGATEKLFSKGTAYPLKNNYNYKLKVPFSLTNKISINLFEKDNKKIYKISDVNFYHPCFYTGDFIDLSVNIDENGLLTFKAIHFETNEEIEFTSDKSNSINENLIRAGYKHIKEKVKYVEGKYNEI